MVQKVVQTLSLIILLSSISCNKNKDCDQPTGEQVSQIFELPFIKGIDLKTSAQVFLSQDSVQSILIEGGINQINNIKKTVENHVWTIENKGSCSNQGLKIFVKIPHIEDIYISGSGTIYTEDFKTNKSVTLKISGSGNMKLNKVDGANKMIAKISGSGNINLLDSLTLLNEIQISMSGSGDFMGFKAPSLFCTISNSGSGSNNVTVINKLKASISGSGDTFFKGHPQIESSISGSGSIVDVN